MLLVLVFAWRWYYALRVGAKTAQIADFAG